MTSAELNSLDWRNDGTRLAGVFQDGTLVIWETTSGQILQQIVTSAPLNDVDWNSDGSQLVTASDEGNIQIWQTSSLTEISKFTYSGRPLTLAWQPNDAQIAIGGVPTGSTETLQLIDTSSVAVSNLLLLAEEGLWLRQGVTVEQGDLAVNRAGNPPYLSNNSTVTLDEGVTLPPDSTLSGDSLFLAQNAEAGNAAYNTLRGQGTIAGDATTPLELPVVDDLPLVPDVQPSDDNQQVGNGDSLLLGAGSYGALDMAQDSRVTFSGGTYHFQSWRVGLNAEIRFAAPTEIRIADRLIMQPEGLIAPADEATGLDASDLMIYVLGEQPQGNPARAFVARLGDRSSIQANLYVPNGTLQIGNRSGVRGAFIARWLIVGNRSRLQLVSGF